MKFHHLILLFLLLTSVFLKAPTSGNIFDAKNLHKLRRLSGSVVSPDGNYVVYQVRIWDEKTGKVSSHLRYTNLVSKKSSDLTEYKIGISDTNPAFSSNFQEFLAFLRTSEGRTHVYYIQFPPLEGDPLPTPVKLTDYPIDVSDLKWKANVLGFKSDVYYHCDSMKCSDDMNKKVKERGENTWVVYNKLMVRHWDTWLVEGKTTHGFIQKVSKEGPILQLVGEPKDLLQNYEMNLMGDLDISPDGKEIAFSGQERTRDEAWTTSWDTFRYNLDSMTAPLNITSDVEGRTQNPKYSKDGTKIAYLAMTRPLLESDHLHLEIYNIQTNTRKKIDDLIDRCIDDFMWYDDKTILVEITDKGVSTLMALDMTDIDHPIFTQIIKDLYSYSIPIEVPSQIFLVVSRSSFISPADLGLLYYSNKSKKGIFTELTNINEDLLTGYELTKPESFEFMGGNNDTVQGWIMKPINFNEKRTYPLAFLIHGGPEGSWESSWGYRWNPQLWTNRGYVVVMINPHGSSGMGIKFQDAVRNNWGGVPYLDLMTGLDYVLSKYPFIDPERMCAAGASYGGYMVNWIQGKTDRFKCLVTHDGVFSTVSMFYATDELWFPRAEYCSPDKIGCTPFDGEEAREGYEKFNPESLIKNWKTPHLIIHGSNDYRLHVTEGISAFTALQLKGVPSRFLHFPEENHWVLKAENCIKWYDEVIGWMDIYTQ